MFQKTYKVSASLNKRIIITLCLGILIVVSLTAFAINWSFSRSVDRSLYNQLGAFNDLLISATIVKNGKVTLFDKELLSRLPRYWQVIYNGKIIASSPSFTNLIDIPVDKRIFKFITQDGTEVLASSETIYFPKKIKVTYIFGMQKEIALAFVRSEHKQFLSTLLPVLFLMIVALLLLIRTQVAVILSPLDRIKEKLHAVSSGLESKLSGDFPVEIEPLIKQINLTLDYSNNLISRYRQFASNIAHALKTPLTVLANEAKLTESNLALIVQEKTAIMLGVVERNLARVRISGANIGIFSKAIDINELTSRIISSFGKLYQKDIELVCNEKPLLFRIDENDIYEIIGNIVENSCKYCNKNIKIELKKIGEHLQIIVEDDGMGIKKEQRFEVLNRGIRLDETKPGSGIGLSLVQEIVKLYNGQIILDESNLGGLKVTIDL